MIKIYEASLLGPKHKVDKEDVAEVVLFADHLADKEAAVHEWQDIAGQWEDKCQKLTEMIAALTAEITEYEKVIEEVKLDSAAIHELAGRQAEEIIELNQFLEDDRTMHLSKDALKQGKEAP